MSDENRWRTIAFRVKVVAKIDELIREYDPTRNSIEMENEIFTQSQTKEEYLGSVARLILKIQALGVVPNGLQEQNPTVSSSTTAH